MIFRRTKCGHHLPACPFFVFLVHWLLRNLGLTLAGFTPTMPGPDSHDVPGRLLDHLSETLGDGARVSLPVENLPCHFTFTTYIL